MMLACKERTAFMELDQLYNLQFMMFAELAAGYLLCRFHILEPKNRKILSKAVIYLFFPANIIAAFNVKLNAETAAGFAAILTISILIQILSALIAAVAFPKAEPGRKEVLQFGTVCSNAGFLGNAVAEGIYGQSGLMYGQIYLIPLRIVMWSAGVSYFEKGKGKADVIRKVLTHPCIIAVIIGLIRMILNIPVPAAVDMTLTSLGRCATPLIMVFLGMVTYEAGFRSMISKQTLYYSFIRLFLIPAIVLCGCMIMKTDPLIGGLSVLLCAMPAGTTTVVVAEQYNADVRFAADCIVLTTLLSLAVLPLWSMAVSYLL